MITKLIKLILPKKLFNFLKNIYRRNFKTDYKIDSNKLIQNRQKLKFLNFDEKEINKILERNNLCFLNKNLSWHYHIFAGLKSYALINSKNINNILEIGTHNGEFTNFISSLFPNTNIYTIDLAKSDAKFLSTYNRKDKAKFKEFITKRNKNLNERNIKFIEISSSKLINYFNEFKFDIIWIDGDHHNPQVTLDILNSINLIKKDGIICIDDVIKDKKFKKDKYVSNESFNTLDLLESNKILKNLYLNKRIRKCYYKTEKYIAVSKFHDEYNH